MKYNNIRYFGSHVWFIFIFIVAMSQFVISQATAADGVTTVTSSFLRIDLDARGTAMGGAHGALTGDLYSVYWNPAGLSDVALNEVGFTYQRAFLDMNYGFLGYAAPVKYFGVLAGQLFFLSSGSITYAYENEDGSFANFGDTSSALDVGLGLSQSRKITADISYGLGLKILIHKLMDEQAFSFALDAGIIYRDVIENLDFGFALQNLSNSYSFLSQDLHEPRIIKLASLYSLSEDQLLLAGDLNICFGGSDTINLGAEYWVMDLIALRVGMKLPPTAGLMSALSTGFGLNWRDTYRLDYSFSPHEELGSNHRFSIIVKF